MKTRFFIYGLIGWCVEVFWTGLGSLFKGDITMHGWSYIWMFPIYGMAVLLEPVHDILRNKPVVLRGGVYTILIFAVEFSTGLLLRLLIGRCPWNYGSGPYSIYGIITLTFIPVWFCAGLLFEKVHDILIRMGIGKRAESFK